MQEPAEFPVIDETVSFETAQELLSARGLADGLPLVPPTRHRLETMLSGIANRNQSYGLVPPMFGDLNPAAVAYNCVLAGCAPAAVPIVLSAAEACLEPEFNLLGILTTTGTPAIATIVHGPVAAEVAMNAGTNCLGPGNHANATIGRAIALVLRNIGGARAETGDMATMGQPGKYTFCFPERNDAALPVLATRRGMPANSSAVTVLGVSGTAEILPTGGGDTPEAILHPVAAAMIAVGAIASANRQRDVGEQFFLLPMELVEKLAKHDWDLARIQHYLFETRAVAMPEIAAFTSDRAVARSANDIHPIVTGGAGVKMTYLPLWAGGTVSVTKAVRDLKHGG